MAGICANAMATSAHTTTRIRSAMVPRNLRRRGGMDKTFFRHPEPAVTTAFARVFNALYRPPKDPPPGPSPKQIRVKRFRYRRLRLARHCRAPQGNGQLALRGQRAAL